MDGFGDNFDQADVDPAAEFLAREKDQLAGLEDEVGLATGLSTLNLDGEGAAINQGMSKNNNKNNNKTQKKKKKNEILLFDYMCFC